MGDIFGGNQVQMTLFLVADLLVTGLVLQSVDASSGWLGGIGVVVTALFAGGLVLRLPKKFAGIGPDLGLVPLMYAIGLAGLRISDRGGLSHRRASTRSGSGTRLLHEVGATLRTYSMGGLDVLDGFGLDEQASAGRGQVLAPWPNRPRRRPGVRGIEGEGVDRRARAWERDPRPRAVAPVVGTPSAGDAVTLACLLDPSPRIPGGSSWTSSTGWPRTDSRSSRARPTLRTWRRRSASDSTHSTGPPWTGPC